MLAEHHKLQVTTYFKTHKLKKPTNKQTLIDKHSLDLPWHSY